MIGQRRFPKLTSLSLKAALAAAMLTLLAGCGGTHNISGIVSTTRGKWTVLVYMNAANDLDIYSAINVIQMQQVATNPDVRFVVQWKQSAKVTPTATFNGTRRYLITPSLGGGVQSQLVQDLGQSVDMGIPSSLHDFIRWGKSRYPADHTAVILWDHGNGWLPAYRKASTAPPAFSYDEQTGHSIQIAQLNQAFRGQHVDIVAFDCSLMQMAEVAYQFIGLADYVAGSEESPPGAGYPYQRVLAPFTGSPDLSPRTLAKAFVDGMIDEPSYSTMKVEESVIDTSQLGGVATAASALRQQLVANAGSLGTIIPGLRTTVQSYERTTRRYFFDSVDLCSQLGSASSDPAIQSACAAFSSAVTNAVVWEGHNAQSPGSHGLGIDFSPSGFFSTVKSDYRHLSWDSATGWSQWLSISP